MRPAGSAHLQSIESQLGQARELIARTRQALQAAGIAHRPSPAAPTTCCGRGCHGCVWEGWYAAVQYWREQADELLAQRQRVEAAEKN